MVSIQLRLLPDEAARVMKAFEVAGGRKRADGAVALAEAPRSCSGGRVLAEVYRWTPAPI